MLAITRIKCTHTHKPAHIAALARSEGSAQGSALRRVSSVQFSEVAACISMFSRNSSRSFTRFLITSLWLVTRHALHFHVHLSCLLNEKQIKIQLCLRRHGIISVDTFLLFYSIYMRLKPSEMLCWNVLCKCAAMHIVKSAIEIELHTISLG